MTIRSEVCPLCRRSTPLTKAGYMKSHRAVGGRYGRGPYCKGSGCMTSAFATGRPAGSFNGYTVASIIGRTLVLTAPNGETVEYHASAAQWDTQGNGPLKAGDRLERDPDGLHMFIRVGDFQ